MLSRPLPSSRRTPYLSGMEDATPTPDAPAPGQFFAKVIEVLVTHISLLKIPLTAERLPIHRRPAPFPRPAAPPIFQAWKTRPRTDTPAPGNRPPAPPPATAHPSAR